jgi:hypothetical protein
MQSRLKVDREAVWCIEIDDTYFFRLLISKATGSIFLCEAISLKKKKWWMRPILDTSPDFAAFAFAAAGF